jgi:DNA-3-methyladenine glycosylase II
MPDPTTPAPANDLYLSLLESIVSQQISVKAADAIFARFLALFPDNDPQAELLLLKTTENYVARGCPFRKSSTSRA